jgi:succinate dehydrogenase / fumarate reductase cytochrome b subunit
MTEGKRPVNLNLARIRFPVTAVLSILHRFSGVILLLSGLLVCWLLSISVQNEAGFQRAVNIISSEPVRWLGVVLVWALAHHLFAGIRFLLLDLEIGVGRRPARASAWLVNFAALLAAVAYLTGIVL